MPKAGFARSPPRNSRGGCEASTAISRPAARWWTSCSRSGEKKRGARTGTDGTGLGSGASALLAYLPNEPGNEAVEAALAVGAVITAVNYAEVLACLGDAGAEPGATHRRLQEQGVLGDLLRVIPLVSDDSVAITRLRPFARAQGLSIGDRARLATGLRLERTVVTADRRWAAVDAGVVVRLIR